MRQFQIEIGAYIYTAKLVKAYFFQSKSRVGLGFICTQECRGVRVCVLHVSSNILIWFRPVFSSVCAFVFGGRFGGHFRSFTHVAKKWSLRYQRTDTNIKHGIRYKWIKRICIRRPKIGNGIQRFAILF